MSTASQFLPATGPVEQAAQPAPTKNFVFKLWLTLRLAFIPLALLGAIVKPRPGQEPLWPLTADWLSRVLLEPWNRWDTIWYVKIAELGYRADDGTSQFHPLFPMLGRAIGWLLGGHMLLGLLLVASICALLFLKQLQQLAAMDLPPAEAQRAVLYFMHLPAAFILFAPYTESLFLLCSITAFLLARRGRWGLAGLAGALTVLTRQQGVFLLIPLAWEAWVWAGRDWRKLLHSACGLALLPAGLLVWLGFRAFWLSDVVIDWSQPQTLIYGLLISRTATHVVPVQSFVPPWQALWTALHCWNAPTVIDLLGGGVFLALFALSARTLWRLRPSYLLYTAATLTVSFSYWTGVPQPYMGLPRHCLLAFPLVFALAILGRSRRVDRFIMMTGLLWLIGLPIIFAATVLWVP